ncbi:hypothetical protein ILYODFUR_020451, partial [Ilyodon furcidens]
KLAVNGSLKASTWRSISAKLPCNTSKNRLGNIIPFESNRVCLQPIRGKEGSDYINASFIDGYRHRKAYIATQGPLAKTTEDLWRMLWEHNSTIVIMLTKLHEMGRVKYNNHVMMVEGGNILGLHVEISITFEPIRYRYRYSAVPVFSTLVCVYVVINVNLFNNKISKMFYLTYLFLNI